jgi:hypothetical protein
MPINSIVSWFMKKRLHQIELFLKYPTEVQHDVFNNLTRKATYTEYGKAHDFAHILSVEQFKKQVPLVTYDDLKPYIERTIKGEQNLLWPTEINWFAKSSGTSGEKSKFIPVSREALEGCHYKGGKDLLALYYRNNPKNKMYTGKTLVVGGSQEMNVLGDNASYAGDLSAIIIRNLPTWVELRRTPDKTIALMDDWEDKIEQMAKATMKQNVSNISGVPSWTLVLLKRILELNNTNNILDVWPNLELYMHGGVNFEPYRSQFEALIPSDSMSYYQSYNASEGFFGLQDREVAKDMLLMLDYGIFYEFIPPEEQAKDQPDTIGLEEVELGVNYAIVISTNGGLWRYKLGDTVVFTALDPFRIQVTGRTTHFINAFGEELIIDNADQGVAKACERTGAIIRDYTAGPIYMGDDTDKGAHEWLIEFEQEPDSIQFFTEVLDNALKALNSDYEAKRSNNLSMGPPVIRSMPKNTFYDWMKSKGKLGGQNKVPRLQNDRSLIAKINKMLEPVASDA